MREGSERLLGFVSSSAHKLQLVVYLSAVPGWAD